MKCVAVFIIFTFVNYANCWTTEDLELFDLVETTPKNFYDVLGVDPKASSADIRKAYRKLSSLYHPDKNSDYNAEEVFRQIAAVADVLRNDERRKTYDLILQTGLPDWRAPIYYYRRFRKMGLLDLTIFLFCLATVGQYLFAWSAYYEKKLEIEELVISKIRKKAKNQRKKDKKAEIDEDETVKEVVSSIPKPRCQDLFPVRLVYFLIHVIISSPSYLATCIDYIKLQAASIHQKEEEILDEDPKAEVHVRYKKQVKPKIPDYEDISHYENGAPKISNFSITPNVQSNDKQKISWNWDTLTEQQILDFKKAIKKYPVGTLERWVKVAAYLDCSVSEVVTMISKMKNQQVSKNVPTSAQGVTGTEKENFGSDLYSEKGVQPHEKDNICMDAANSNEISEKYWKQEEQKALELALQRYPKDTPARWDKIANFVSTKSKEECVERFKIIAQQIKKKKRQNSLTVLQKY